VTWTLAEAAEKTGRSQAVLRKHIERGKLRATKDGSRTVIADEDLDRYLASEELERTATALQVTESLEPLGKLLSRLPPAIQQAILDGMPSGKKQGGPEPFLKAIGRAKGTDLPVRAEKAKEDLADWEERL
jgi:excisionase family DNA binding protein